MSSPTSFDTPPLVGPFGRRRWARGRWRTRLTPEGKRRLADWLAAYPEPARLCFVAWPGLTRRATESGIDWVELNGLCQLAAVRAMMKYDPDHVKKADFATHARWEMRNVVGMAIAQRMKAARRGLTLVQGSHSHGDADGNDLLSGVADPRPTDPARPMETEELREAVADVLRRHVASQRDRNIFALCHGLEDGRPLTFEQVARRIGRTRQRIQQIEARILRRVRDELEALYRDHCLTA